VLIRTSTSNFHSFINLNINILQEWHIICFLLVMKHTIYITILLLLPFLLKAQKTLTLTLSEAIEMARRNSPEAIAARHAFRASYWNWRSFRAKQLPSLTLTSDPSLNRSIQSVTLEDGSDKFVHRNQLSVDAGLEIQQNIALTGGRVLLKTGLERLDMFTDNISSYKSTPVVVGYEQDLFGFNDLKWERRIEPIKYEEAKKTYIETLELVAAYTTNRFFNLATAQTSLEIANYNFAYADTLYRYAQGRYNIGTITENEMLQLELNKLTEQTNRLNAQIEVDDYIQSLRSYLGISENITLVVIPDDSIPHFTVDVNEAMQLAFQNNPDISAFERRRLQSESNVAEAKANRGFKAALYAQFGLTQSNEKLKESYRDPMDQQLVTLGIRIPILDWGVGKGRVKVAKSNRDKVYTELEQERMDFELNVAKIVKQFNIQAGKVAIAYKTDQTAQRRNDVARRLYLLGKSTILDLNAAIAEKDNSRRAYITALYNYWNLYYGLRSLTGYDFEKRKLRTEAENLIIGEATSDKFLEYVDVEGVVQPILTIQINAREAGSVDQIIAEEGTMMNKGDTILTLNNPDLIRTIEDQQDEWEKQLISYQEKEIEMEQKSIDLQQETLQTTYELNRLKKSYALDEEEFNMGVKSKAQLEVARDEFDYKTRSTALQLEGLRHDSAATILRRELMKNDLERERKKFERARERMEDLIVRAPLSGQLSFVKVTPGQQVQSTEAIAEIKVLDQFKIHTSLSEYYIDRITTGLPATITWQNKKFPLRITKVVPEVKDRNFDVDLVFTETSPENVRIGKSFRVQIELGQPEEALVIPRGDFFQTTGGQWIYKLNESGTKARKTPISIGRQNPQQYEITGGLQSGDKVIVTGYSTFGDAEELILK